MLLYLVVLVLGLLVYLVVMVNCGGGVSMGFVQGTVLLLKYSQKKLLSMQNITNVVAWLV